MLPSLRFHQIDKDFGICLKPLNRSCQNNEMLLPGSLWQLKMPSQYIMPPIIYMEIIRYGTDSPCRDFFSLQKKQKKLMVA